MGKHQYAYTPKLEDYKKQFADYLIMERNNGILQLRLHTKGGPVKWSDDMHQAMVEAWTLIGHDPENEVLILTSTDPYWIGEFDHEAIAESEADPDPNRQFNIVYHDVTKVAENFVWDIDIPTISAINGPGIHWEWALLSDITLCTEDFVVQDDHFKLGMVPGDCQALCLQGLIGIKRAAYMMFMSNGIDAKTALDWGIVNEVLPKDKLLPRAWEIAEQIMKQPRAIRRLTRQLTNRPWKRLFMNDYQVHVGHENYGYALLKTKHDFKAVKQRWTE